MTSPHLPGRARVRRLESDLRFYRNLLALLPYTVRVDRDAETRARVASRIPAQRRPVDLWPTPRPTPRVSPRRAR